MTGPLRVVDADAPEAEEMGSPSAGGDTLSTADKPPAEEAAEAAEDEVLSMYGG